jgi:hypothetical protein
MIKIPIKKRLEIYKVILEIIILIIFTSFFSYKFIANKIPSKVVVSQRLTVNCVFNNKSYQITVGENNYYLCSNCGDKLNKSIKNSLDKNSVSNSAENIKKYFNNIGGSCS